MARSDDGVVWMTCQIPGREQRRYVCRLGRPGWHEHDEALDLAALDCFETINQQQVVLCWRETDGLENYTAPLNEVAANGASAQQFTSCGCGIDRT
jgi:hypothetical protein